MDSTELNKKIWKISFAIRGILCAIFLILYFAIKPDDFKVVFILIFSYLISLTVLDILLKMYKNKLIAKEKENS